MLESNWSTIKEKLAAEAMRVSRVASTLEHQSLQPLQVFLFTDLEKRFQSTVQDGRKIIKDYSNARGLLQKSKEKYYGLDVVGLVQMWFYSRKFSMVQNFAELPPNPPEEFFVVLIFMPSCYGETTPIVNRPHARPNYM